MTSDLQENWMYALSAPMVAINKQCGAEFFLPSFFNDILDVPEMLRRDWSINDRQQLLIMIQDMTDNGHATHLAGSYQYFNQASPSQWQQFCITAETDYQKFFNQFVEKTAMACGTGGILAWDLGRMGFLIRCGLLLNWLTYQESLWLHWRLTLRARYYYTSWHSYYSAFYYGRIYWLTCSQETLEELENALDQCTYQSTTNADILHHLFKGANSPSFILPWYIDLHEIDKPSSLKEFDWS